MLPLHAVGSLQLADLRLHSDPDNSVLVLVENPMHPLAFNLALWDLLHPYSAYHPQNSSRMLLEV